ncbi:LLM class flavin-dependent oxidoreductase [Nocardia gamkensis]|uniref:LLM class flavin-dependent oxidoreductase n=1 Tax=Nocardia gamkensis TaxID=352869 RepID=UPI0036EBD3A9
MKFGILFTSQPNPDTEPYPHRAVHERVISEVVEADRLGYDYAWIAEHHVSTRYGIMPDPLTFIAHLAPQTSQIRLGTGVMTLPLQNILRLAENTALVDILTNGRLMLGVGSGYRKYEFEALGGNFDGRRDVQVEALEVLMTLLTEHRIDHHGDHFDISVGGDYEVLPHSLQQPYPPLYMAAASEQSIGLGARFGLGLLLSTLMPFGEVAEVSAFYREKCDQTAEVYTQNPGFRDIDLARFVYVADTDAEAKAQSAEGIMRHIASFTQGQTSGYLGTVNAGDRKIYSEIDYDKLTQETILHGSPETVVDRIKEIEERTGATSLMLHFPPYYGPERTAATLEMFAETVMPKFR